MSRLLKLICVVPLLVACNGQEMPKSMTQDAEGLTPIVDAYEGTLKMFHPNGSQAGTMKVLSRTRGYQAQKLIVDQTIQVDQADTAHPTELITMLTVDGTKFDVTEVHDKLAGTGNFTAGDPWKWTSWTMKHKTDDDLIVDSVMTKSGDALTVQQTLKTDAGSVMFTLTGSLSKISESDFKTKYKQIFPDPDE